MARRVIIMGAAGRDFHNFNVFFRHNTDYHVVAFTATQIPGIAGRVYPPSLAGPNYPAGIPILPETDLDEMMRTMDIDLVVFAYSDVSHEYLMHKASQVLAKGPDFMLMGPDRVMLSARVPVVAITAVRTGSGKSQSSRRVAEVMTDLGYKIVVIRHPMPYGNLEAQTCQRYSSAADLERYGATIEEREEYELHLSKNVIVYAGVDYESILRSAEQEADLIIWDGGNNDLPFIRPDFMICVADALRPGHEMTYYPGEVNVRMADVVIINKVDSADQVNVDIVKNNCHSLNPNATIIEAASPIYVDHPELIKDRRVLVIEDGPTITHGEMGYGAGRVAAKRYGAAAIIDPHPYAVGSLGETLRKWSHIDAVLPAMGYDRRQLEDLEETIRRTPCDTVVAATPVDLTRIVRVNKPIARVYYDLHELTRPNLADILTKKFGHKGHKLPQVTPR